MGLDWSSLVSFNISDNQLCPPYPDCIDGNENGQDTSNCFQVSIYDPSTPLLDYRLNDAWPNPFNPTTNISYTLPNETEVSIMIYDLMGRIIWDSYYGKQRAGTWSFQWNAVNHAGDDVSTGVYLCTLQAGHFKDTKKLIYVK